MSIIDQLLAKVDPQNLSFMAAVFISLWLVFREVWPVIRDKWIPAQLEMEKIKLDREYELQSRNTELIADVRSALTRITTQLENFFTLFSLVNKPEKATTDEPTKQT